jgi:beta-aspartyl-peptidase (threonine type)
MRHRGDTLLQASREALKAVARIGGDGGLVAVDRRGTIAMPFTSEGMFRACIGAHGRRLVKIYR